jgi:PAS domain S-box-containing protein
MKRPKTKKQFEAILEHVADGIVVQDRKAQIVFVNPAAARMLGFASPELAMRAGRDRILDRFDLFDERGDPLPVELLPGRQALRGKPEVASIVRARSNEGSDTGMRWGWLKASPIQDEDGNLEYVVTVFQEITALKTAELGLAEANQRIMHLLEQTLKTL